MNVLSKSEFKKRFGKNRHIPANDRDAKKLLDTYYPKDMLKAIKDESGKRPDQCGEQIDAIFEALKVSPFISETLRKEIKERTAVPVLEKEETFGHFRFHWSETGRPSFNNVSRDNVQKTADELNDCWEKFKTDFGREPKSEEGLIEVNIYRRVLVLGATSSESNEIFLNVLAVEDDCERKTTSAHELFHRMQYTYGYITGSGGQDWWVEAMAAWSQQYSYPNIYDYISRMNSGFEEPETALLERSYDGCHYWKYLGETAARNSGISEREAIEKFLIKYQENNNDPILASQRLMTEDLGFRDWEEFIQLWLRANYTKRLEGISSTYDYNDDGREFTNECGETYSYSDVPEQATMEVYGMTTFQWEGEVGVSGAHYYPVDTTNALFDIEKIELRFSNAENEPDKGTFILEFLQFKVGYNVPSVSTYTIDYGGSLTARIPLIDSPHQACILIYPVSEESQELAGYTLEATAIGTLTIEEPPIEEPPVENPPVEFPPIEEPMRVLKRKRGKKLLKN